MIKLILCEGKTDAIFLSYYLEQVCGWTHKFPKDEIPKNFSINSNIKKGESMEWYRRADDFLLICGVGGKDNFGSFIKSKIIPAMIDGNVFSKIAIVTDRDDREESSICQSFQSLLKPVVSLIDDNVWIGNRYKNSFGQEKTVDFLLLIIPSDKEGALETTLMDAIAEIEYDRVIVESSKEFVASIAPMASRYIGKNRLKLKTCLGVIWSIQSPEKIFSFIDEQIRSVKWEKSELIAQCFNKLMEI
jgi:hypothetical protein